MLFSSVFYSENTSVSQGDTSTTSCSPLRSAQMLSVHEVYQVLRVVLCGSRDNCISPDGRQ